MLSSPASYSPTSTLSYTVWDHPDEQRAVDFYSRKAGPWLANYNANEVRSFWETDLLQAALGLPASRHLLQAVALLETPSHSFDHSAMQTQSQRIVYNYTRALHELNQPQVDPLDTVLAPFLGWLLETLSINQSKAAMHSQGAQEFFQASLLRKAGIQPKDDALVAQILHMLKYIRRFGCMRCKAPMPPQIDGQMYMAVAARNMTIACPSITTLRSELKEFTDLFNPDIMRPEEVKDAQNSVLKWEIAVIQGRYHAPEMPLAFAALHFLVNAIMLLLPTPVNHDIAGPDTVLIGIDLVLDQCYWILARRLDGPTLDAVKDFTSMTFRIVAGYGLEETRRIRAKDMLTCLRRTGELAEVPWTAPAEDA